MLGRIATSLAALALIAATPAQAKELAFKAALSGDRAPTLTGSKATGEARIVVDTDARTVDVTLDVAGLKVEDLWTNLLHSPMGAIHLHVYGGHDHTNPDAAALVFPLPYGPTYAATDMGFRVVMKHYPYATGAALVNTQASFDDFVGSLQSGRIVLNVHTNRHQDGEISGDVVPAG